MGTVFLPPYSFARFDLTFTEKTMHDFPPSNPGASFKTPPFARSLRQAKILILEIPQCIPVVKISVFLNLEQN